MSLTQHSLSPAVEAEAVTGPPRTAPRRDGPAPPHRRRTDVLMVVLSLATACWITSGLFIGGGPDHRVLRINASDQAFFEWLLAYAANCVRHGINPFWTSLLNAPDGVNLASNTAVTVLGVVLSPLTLTIGPTMTFTLALTAALALTPVAWYLLLSRAVVRTRTAAVVGGLFCGFAPGMVSHANGHLNFASGYLVPLIVWRVMALRRPGHALRNGLVLGALIAVQYSLGGETLFFTALACGVVLGCWLLAGHREPRPTVLGFGKGLAVAAVAAAVLLAYPLWMQFMGPRSFHGTGFDQFGYSEDLLAYGAWPRRSIAGEAGFFTFLAFNRTEENSFFGVPALLVLVGMAILAIRRGDAARRRLTWAVSASALVFAVLSLGPELKVDRKETGVPLPYALLQHVPLFDSALPGRYALVVAVLAGVLLALGIDTLPGLRHRRLVAVGVAAGLLPLVPVTLLTYERSPVPHFVTSGKWREYVQPGETLVPVPLPSDLLPDGQRWQAALLAGPDGDTFRIPGGFFLGPGGPDGRGRIGAVPRNTVKQLDALSRFGDYPPVATGEFRDKFLDDLRYWQGSVVVLPDGGTGNRWHEHHDDLLHLLTVMLGPAQRVDDVWLWKVKT